MCGRFTLTVGDFDALLEAVDATVEPERLAELAELPLPRYNIAPTQEHWIVREQGEGRGLDRAAWGLVNWWAESRREGAKQINARSETAAERRPFREAFVQRRCAVPADGFFEWTGTGRERQPWWFHRPDGEVFLFAGLFEVARLKGEAAPTTTFTILTTTPNGLMEPIHDRMPVILPDAEAVDEWLWSGQSAQRLRELLRPVEERYLVKTAVSRRVNSVQNDDAACLADGESETQGALL